MRLGERWQQQPTCRHRPIAGDLDRCLSGLRILRCRIRRYHRRDAATVDRDVDERAVGRASPP